MCGHVECMRGRRCKLRILARGREPFLRHVRPVVGVDEVVRYSWMIRFLSEQLLQDCRSFQPIRVCAAVIGGKQAQCIKGSCLMILRIPPRDFLHGFRITFGTLLVWPAVMPIERT